MLPRLSVICAVYNDPKGLDHTLRQTFLQDYPAIDMIVVDGGSDGPTQAVLQRWGHRVHVISEPDKGIADAFNKGLRVAKGDYITFQGAGDGFVAIDSVSMMMDDVEPKEDTLLCGKVRRVSLLDRQPLWEAPRVMPSCFRPSSLLWKMSLPHQGLFTHRRFFDTYGDFSLDFRFAMDYEHLLRAYANFPKVLLRPFVVADWQEGGIGTDRTLAIYDEYHRIKSLHQVASPLLLQWIDTWNRAKYHIKGRLHGK